MLPAMSAISPRLRPKSFKACLRRASTHSQIIDLNFEHEMKSSIIRSAAEQFRRFIRDQRGNVAMAFSVTALPAINAIPHVCRAAPGIRGYGDLPLITGAGFCSKEIPA